jgi:hypothetical protein
MTHRESGGPKKWAGRVRWRLSKRPLICRRIGYDHKNSIRITDVGCSKGSKRQSGAGKIIALFNRITPASQEHAQVVTSVNRVIVQVDNTAGSSIVVTTYFWKAPVNRIKLFDTNSRKVIEAEHLRKHSPWDRHAKERK